MKRKWLIISVVFLGLALLAISIYFNQLRYPALPADVDSVTPREVLQKLNESDQPLVEISRDDKATWYIMRNSEDVNQQIEKLVSSRDWVFKGADGNSLFLKKTMIH